MKPRKATATLQVPTGRQAAALRQKWRRWLVRLESQVRRLVIDYHLYKEIGVVIKANPVIQQPYTVQNWMGRNYGLAAAVGIRKLFDRNAKSYSIANLLTDIKRHAPAMTRQSHLWPYSRVTHSIGQHYFDRVAGLRAMSLSPTRVRADSRRLRRACDKVRLIVTKRLAHFDRRSSQRKVPTFDELGLAVREIERIFLKYQLLLTGSAPVSMLPTYQFDWRSVFYKPWISSGG